MVTNSHGGEWNEFKDPLPLGSGNSKWNRNITSFVEEDAVSTKRSARRVKTTRYLNSAGPKVASKRERALSLFSLSPYICDSGPRSTLFAHPCAAHLSRVYSLLLQQIQVAFCPRSDPRDKGRSVQTRGVALLH